MDKLIPLALAFVGIAILIRIGKELLRRKKEPRIAASSGDYPFRKTGRFLTPTEYEFFKALLVSINTQMRVFTKVRLIDLLEFDDRHPEAFRWKSRVIQKHVDFVLCDARYVRPFLVIELDDPSHFSRSAQKRDAVKDEALAAAKIPLLRIKSDEEYDRRVLARKIEEVAYG